MLHSSTDQKVWGFESLRARHRDCSAPSPRSWTECGPGARPLRYTLAWLASRMRGDVMAMDWHDTLMGSVLVISGGLTFTYTRAASRILLILTLIGAAATFVIGVLLFFHLA